MSDAGQAFDICSSEGSPKASLPGRAHCSNSQRDESGTALPATQKRRRTKIKLMFEDDYIEPLREAKDLSHGVVTRDHGHLPLKCLDEAQALDMSVAPRRFNASRGPEARVKSSVIQSSQQPQPSRHVLNASQALSNTAQPTQRSCKELKDAKKQELKRAREAERDFRAKQKAQSMQAKAAERRARGGYATDEIEVTVDFKLAGLKHGKAVMAAFDNSDIKYRYKVLEGKLTNWSAITWQRDVMGSDTIQVPYVMLVLTGRQGEDILSSSSNVKQTTTKVFETYGAVTLSLLFIGLERHLMAKERADHRSAANGQLDPAQSFSARKHMHNLLRLHFWDDGVVYRDCKDAAQAAEHVIGITAAIAHQPYKGGEDNVAAFTKKKPEALASAAGGTELSVAQRQVFKALAGVVRIGPLSAKAVTCKYHSLGVITRDLLCSTDGEFCNEVENLQAGARRVGPAAVKRLQWLFTSEDPDARLPR